MGEDTLLSMQQKDYTPSMPYLHSFNIKEEEEGVQLEHFPMHNLDRQYCSDPKTNGTVTEQKAYDSTALPETFNHAERPQLHHMASISTTCTSDSFSAGDLTEVSSYDLNATETQEYEWTYNTASFQWPPNHNLATPPLESPATFQIPNYASNVAHPERHSFPAALAQSTSFYPLTPTGRRPSQPMLFQPYHPNPSNAQMIYSRSSGEDSKSTTPTNLQSPPLTSTPRPTKKGSVSSDIPTGRNRGISDVSAETASTRDAIRLRRASISASQQQRLSRSPNRSHQRRSSAMPTAPSFALPLSQDLFADDKHGRMQIKRSKSANIILQQQLPQDEGDSSGEGEEIPQRGDDVDAAKTKAARAQSEHRRRVELKESFERLRITLGVPQPRAGKKDLVEQAIMALESYKRREGEMMQEILFLRQAQQKYLFPPKSTTNDRRWPEDMVHSEEMQL